MLRDVDALVLVSDRLATGAQWIANPSAINNYSTIAGEAVLWGDGMLWGDSILVGSNSVLTGSGSTDFILFGTAVKWAPNFVDPNSMATGSDALSILIFGNAPCSLQVGPQGAWFYPTLRQWDFN